MADELQAPSIDAMLSAPLDEGRIRQRDGRGADKFSYLATHDVIRTANRIFGFGGWSHEIQELVLLHETPVVDSRNAERKGLHVAYRCIARVSVMIPDENDDERWATVTGAGYGDATEYTPTALNTAHELALKEAESDAMKRALRCFGDQFGLILYAKDDERARIETEIETANMDPVEKAKAELRAKLDRPKDWPTIGAMFAEQASQPIGPWMASIVDALHPGNSKVTDLTADQQGGLAAMMKEVCLDVAVEGPGAGAVPPISNEEIQRIVFERCGVPVKIPEVEPVAAPA